MKPLDRNDVLHALREHLLVLRELHGVAALTLFGSFARDAATDASDVDILVRFNGSATSETYFGVLFYLEDLLGRSVDLVTDKALRPELQPYVEREAIDV